MAEDEPEDSEPVRITRAQIEQIREMHAAFLSDPANAGKPRPVIQVSDRDEKDFSETTYLFIGVFAGSCGCFSNKNRAVRASAARK